MAMYEIEQYETHSWKYHVEAASPADAIRRLVEGEAESVGATGEFVEVAEDFGMPVAKHQELARELRAIGVAVRGDVIPAVRSVRQVRIDGSAAATDPPTPAAATPPESSPPPIAEERIENFRCLKLNVPEWYARPDFVRWLNMPRGPGRALATWHQGGAPEEYSDVFFTFDHGDGSEMPIGTEDDLPQWAWDAIRDCCREQGLDEALIWLTNLGE